MEVISSKDYSYKNWSPYNWTDDVLHDLDRFKYLIDGETVIRVQILRSTDGKRKTPENLKLRLTELVSESNAIHFWKAGEWSVSGSLTDMTHEYEFNFVGGIYRYRTKEIYLTPGEALALYRKLILKQDLHSDRSFFANLRQKHGKDFLKGYLS